MLAAGFFFFLFLSDDSVLNMTCQRVGQPEMVVSQRVMAESKKKTQKTKQNNTQPGKNCASFTLVFCRFSARDTAGILFFAPLFFSGWIVCSSSAQKKFLSALKSKRLNVSAAGEKLIFLKKRLTTRHTQWLLKQWTSSLGQQPSIIFLQRRLQRQRVFTFSLLFFLYRNIFFGLEQMVSRYKQILRCCNKCPSLSAVTISCFYY